MSNPTEAFTSLHNRVAIIVGITALISLPVFILAFFNWPLSDDFAYSIATKHAIEDGGGALGAIEAAIRTSGYYYENWQGLYTSAFLLALQPDIIGAYWLTTFIIVGSIFGGIAFFLYSLQRLLSEQRSPYWLGSSILVTFFFIESLPDIEEGLYWYNGAVNYLTFAALFFALCGLLALSAKDRSRKSRLVLVICATILSFFVAGGNHVIAFVNVLVLFGLLILNLRKRWTLFLPAFCSGLLGLLISLSSPGTAIRQARLNENISDLPGVMGTLKGSLSHAFDLSAEWLTPGLILLLVVLTPFIIACYSQQFTPKRSIFLVLLLLPICILWFAYCPVLYALGSFGAGRVQDCVYLLFLIAVLLLYGYAVFLICAFCPNIKKLSIDLIGARGFALICCTVLLFALPLYGHSSTSKQAFTAVASGDASAYAQAQAERYSDIISSNPGDTILLTSLPKCNLVYDSPSLDKQVAQYNATLAPSPWLNDPDSYYRRQFSAEGAE